MKTNPTFKHIHAILAFVVVFLGLVVNAQAVTSPSSLSVEILEMRVSKNTDCSGAVSVFSASPKTVDLFGSPPLGSGVISTGTYHCVMFRISDIITFTPVKNSDPTVEPLCVSTMTYSYDIFQSPSVSDIPGGSTFSAIGTPLAPHEDDPWIYLSDAPTAATTNDCFRPTKIGPDGPCPMVPLTILSDQTHTLVMNADNQLGLYGCVNTCCLGPIDPVVMSIR